MKRKYKKNGAKPKQHDIAHACVVRFAIILYFLVFTENRVKEYERKINICFCFYCFTVGTTTVLLFVSIIISIHFMDLNTICARLLYYDGCL